MARRARAERARRLAGVPRPVARSRLVPDRPDPARRDARADRPVACAFAVSPAAGGPPATPPIVPGRSDSPREVNLIARDYSFVPSTLDLVPGETVLLHVINGGLEVHEAVIGDAAVQAAWETAEAATVGAPPGPTPVVQVPADVAGVRIVVHSGERVDLAWTVPAAAARRAPAAGSSDATFPGHWAKGMQIPIRWVRGSTP